MAAQPGTQQPNANNAGALSGMDLLKQVEQLVIQQKTDMVEVITLCEIENSYTLRSPQGIQLFMANETSDFCARQCFRSLRPYEIRLTDNFQREIGRMQRPYKCASCCFPCCLQEMEVVSAGGEPLGFIAQEWNFLTPTFRIENAKKEPVFQIVGPICRLKCCSQVEFLIMSKDGVTEVGKIAKQWAGLAKELFTNADNFMISFPKGIDSNMKVTLIGACFLIDYCYFEQK